MENFLSELLFGFRKAHSTKMLFSGYFRNGRHSLTGYAGTIFMDLSKACDSLSHDLLTSELKAYGLDIGRLNFLQVSRLSIFHHHKNELNKRKTSIA